MEEEISTELDSEALRKHSKMRHFPTILHRMEKKADASMSIDGKFTEVFL